MTFVFSEEGIFKCATNDTESLVTEPTDILIESNIEVSPNKTYSLSNGEIVVTDFIPAEDIAAIAQWESVRTERNKLLQDTDWIAIKAYELNETMSNGWKEYRQSLRDVTNQSDPFNIEWPAKPSVL